MALRAITALEVRDESWRGQTDRYIFLSCDQSLPYQSTLSWSAVASCDCELIRLFYALLCSTRSMCRFQFRFVINWTPDRRWLLHSDGYINRNLLVPEGSVFFLRKVSPVTTDTTHTVKVKAVPVSLVQYQYHFPRYRHVRPLQTSVIYCKSRYKSAVCRIRTAVDAVSSDSTTGNLV